MPRTPWGDPDLQGSYTNKYEQSTPLERPEEFVGRRVEDVTGEELARVLAARQEQVLTRPAGVGPFQFRDSLDVTNGSRAWLIVDPPDRPHAGQTLQFEMGDARGRWEGDTLVVETTNFKERSTYRNASAATLRMVERFTPRARGRLESVTVDDPSTWTRPWTFAMPLTMNDGEAVMEFACHKGNYAVPNILSAARSRERDGSKP